MLLSSSLLSKETPAELRGGKSFKEEQDILTSTRAIKEERRALTGVIFSLCVEEAVGKRRLLLNLGTSGQHTHTVNCPLFPLFLSPHLRRTLIHKYMQHDGARSHANALNTNETGPGSKSAWQISSSLVPLG